MGELIGKNKLRRGLTKHKRQDDDMDHKEKIRVSVVKTRKVAISTIGIKPINTKLLKILEVSVYHHMIYG